jgi:DNA-binding CsgD family transcriptional regulator
VANPDASLDLFDGVASLIDASLLRQQEDAAPGGQAEPRFGMLETIREFGLERLAASGEEDAARASHAAYFLALAEEREPFLPIPGDAKWIARLAPEHGNARLALAWLDDRGERERLLRLAVALYEFWVVRGLYAEGRRWLGRALAQAGAAAVTLRARALSYSGTLALFQNDLDSAGALYGEELFLARQTGDDYRIAEALIDLGLLARHRGAYERATELTEEAAALSIRLTDEVPAATPLAGQSLANLGGIALAQGDLDLAAVRYEEALARLRSSGYPWGLCDALTGLGGIAYCRGDVPAAAALLSESLDVAWQQKNLLQVESALLGLVGVAEASGRPEQAARLLGAAEAIAEALGALLIAPNSSDRPVYERSLARLRAVLEEPVLSGHRAAGRALTPEQGVAEARAMLTGMMPAPAPAGRPPSLPGLTPRERDALRLLAAGKTDRQIADALFVSRRTAEWHVRNVLGKLGAANRAEAAALAARQGLT